MYSGVVGVRQWFLEYMPVVLVSCNVMRQAWEKSIGVAFCLGISFEIIRTGCKVLYYEERTLSLENPAYELRTIVR